MSPFYITYGRHPKALPTSQVSTAVPAADDFLDSLLAIQYNASKNISEARKQQTVQANKRRRPSPLYTIGQKVLLSMENIKSKTSTISKNKLQPKWSGPFIVTQYWPNQDNIQLELPADWKIYNIFHTSLIKPYIENDDQRFPSRKNTRPPPVPEADPQEDIYEVEAIRNHKTIRGYPYYLVKWTGWPESDNSWVRESHMAGATELIEEYKSSLTHPPPVAPPAAPLEPSHPGNLRRSSRKPVKRVRFE